MLRIDHHSNGSASGSNFTGRPATALGLPPEQAHRTVLVVEDDPSVACLMADLLAADGYTTLQTCSGREGLRLARQHQPHVVLLDLTLPGKPGLEVLESLKADPTTCEIPVIVVSASAHLMLPREIRRVDSVLSKPFEAADLLAQVERAATRRATRRDDSAPAVASHRPA